MRAKTGKKREREGERERENIQISYIRILSYVNNSEAKHHNWIRRQAGVLTVFLPINWAAIGLVPVFAALATYVRVQVDRNQKPATQPECGVCERNVANHVHMAYQHMRKYQIYLLSTTLYVQAGFDAVPQPWYSNSPDTTRKRPIQNTITPRLETDYMSVTDSMLCVVSLKRILIWPTPPFPVQA